jgi:hypothetical protein
MKLVTFKIANAIGEQVVIENLPNNRTTFLNNFRLLDTIISSTSTTVNFFRWYHNCEYRFSYTVYKLSHAISQ